MIVIGVDAHKRTHTLVALDAGTGVSRGQATVQASDDDGALGALRFAVGLDAERVWAVEDCRHVTARLERALLGAGERVIRVPPSLTGESRKATRTPGKSDPIDARAVALAAIREGVEQLPIAFLDEQAHEIRVLCDYRDQLMHERNRLINRLRLASGQDRPGDRGATRAGLAQGSEDPRQARPSARATSSQRGAEDRKGTAAPSQPDRERTA
jgi:transposase